jgi:hypothetical protein
MKRILLLSLIVLLSVATGAFAAKGRGFAIGAEAASTNFNSWGGMLTLHMSDVPLYFALGGYVDKQDFGLDLKADYWLGHGSLLRGLDWYFGLGGYFSLQVQPSSNFSLGLRIPIGLQIWPMGELLEIFFEAAPAWIPFSNNGVSLGSFALQPALGFRIWF